MLHLPQMLYFVAFATIMLAPGLLAEGIRVTVSGALYTGLGSPMCGLLLSSDTTVRPPLTLTMDGRRVVSSFVVLAAMNLAVHYFTCVAEMIHLL